MHTHYTSQELLQLVNQYLQTLPKQKHPASLYDPIRYVLALGGKRIRPVLMLLSHNIFSGNVEQILPLACGLETYHNYTLLHDDLMDQAPLRRGKPTVHCKWNANTAILSGDSMLVLAYQLMTQADIRFLRQVLDAFTQTALEIGEGQQFDMDFEHRTDVVEEEYIEMIRLKTSVLLACACKIGAITADATPEQADLLYKFGEQLGLAFQLQDDYLDVYGDTATFGKAIGGDIVSNKKTYMLINAFNRATTEQRAELTRWTTLTEFDPQEKIEAVKQLYTEIGIDRLAQTKIAQYFDSCEQILISLDVPTASKEPLLDYAHSLLNRNR